MKTENKKKYEITKIEWFCVGFSVGVTFALGVIYIVKNFL